MLREIDMATHRPKVRKILTLGDFGAGKTNLIRTMINYKPATPILLYSFDKGYDTTAMTPGVMVVEILEGDRRQPKAWLEFNEHFRRFTGGQLKYTWPDGRVEPFRSTALDGLPFLSQYCLNHYQWLGSNVDKKATYTQYQQILENMTDIINAAKMCSEWVIATSLIQITRNELTSEVYFEPDLIGSIRNQLGANFDAVFFQYVDRDPLGKPVYKMKTVGGYREKGKIRLPSEIRDCVGYELTDPSFTRIIEAIDKRVEEVYKGFALPDEARKDVGTLAGAPSKVAAPVSQKPVGVAVTTATPAAPPVPGMVKPAAPSTPVAPVPTPAVAPTAPEPPAPATVAGSTSSGFKPPVGVKIQPRKR